MDTPLRRPRTTPNTPIRKPALLLAALLAGITATGCAFGTRMTPQEPTARSQQLLARALDRAVAKLDVAPLQGRRVRVTLATQGAAKDYAREAVATRLASRGIRVVENDPELELRVLANVLGTDRSESLVGVPPLVIPVLNAPVPEIAIYKVVRNRGLVELEGHALTAEGGDWRGSAGPVVGRSKRDDYTVLLAIHFTVTDAAPDPARSIDTLQDLEEPPPEQPVPVPEPDTER